MPKGHANRKPKPLALDIYSALIGARPRIAPHVPPEDAETIEPPRQPFLHAPLREQVERCAETLSAALDEARLRLIDLVSTSTAGKRDIRPRRHVSVTIGPAARRSDRTAA